MAYCVLCIPNFQLMLGKLKSPRNSFYPDLLHVIDKRTHVKLRLFSKELFGDLYIVATCISLLRSICISNRTYSIKELLRNACLQFLKEHQSQCFLQMTRRL